MQFFEYSIDFRKSGTIICDLVRRYIGERGYFCIK
ncbi:unknown [Bacteroides sp. CAG:702]|nr:unknown [Bacteroides sp. CAG:702]